VTLSPLRFWRIYVHKTLMRGMQMHLLKYKAEVVACCAMVEKPLQCLMIGHWVKRTLNKTCHLRIKRGLVNWLYLLANLLKAREKEVNVRMKKLICFNKCKKKEMIFPVKVHKLSSKTQTRLVLQKIHFIIVNDLGLVYTRKPTRIGTTWCVGFLKKKRWVLI
jgi:hypothetical protein